MRTEHPAGVLGVEVALHHRLEEVPDRCDGGDDRSHHEGVHAGEPVLEEPGEPEGEGRARKAADGIGQARGGAGAPVSQMSSEAEDPKGDASFASLDE